MENEKDKPKKDVLPISYHTFIYPFTYKNRLEEKFTQENSPWKRIHSAKDGKKNVKTILDFNEYQYFLPKARAVIFDDPESDEHHTLTYEYDIAPGKAYYSIIRELKNEEFKNTPEEIRDGEHTFFISYRLEISSLTLQLFPKFEIGVFSFDLENYGEVNYEKYSHSSGDYKALDENELKNFCENPKADETVEQRINFINQLGRRVIVPCLAAKDSKKENSEDTGDPQIVTALLNANKIIISGLHFDSKSGAEEKPIEVDFNNRYLNSETIEFNQPIELISRMLFSQGEKIEEYNIKPVLDDRMFTACLYRKNGYSPLKSTAFNSCLNQKAADRNFDKDSVYRYLNPYAYRSEAERLYKFVFLEDDLSCQNTNMLKEKLEKHVLGRWIDYGTVHAATEYSLVCVTGEGEFLRGSVINPFLTQYIDIVKLALAQRAIITNLEEKTQKVSNVLSSAKNHNSDQFLEDVEGLWQEYILFENQMYLPEVTFQEQGVELYDLIKQSLRLKELNDYLKDAIMNLHNIALIRSERSRIEHEKSEQKNNDMISKNLSMLTIVGVSLAVITFIVNYIAAGQMFLLPGQTGTVNDYVVGSVFQIVGICCMMFLFYKYYKEKLLQYSGEGDSKETAKENSGNRHPANDYIDVIWHKPIMILVVSVIIIIILKPVVVSIISGLIECFCNIFKGR